LEVSSASGSSEVLACLYFDLPSEIENNIKNVGLYITHEEDSVGGEGDIKVAPLNAPWTDRVRTEDDLDEGISVSVGYEVFAHVSGQSEDTSYCDITDIFNAWWDESLEHHGIRLLSNDASKMHYFSSIESSNTGWRPFIRIMTFDE